VAPGLTGVGGPFLDAALPFRDIVPIKPTVSTAGASAGAPSADLAPAGGMDVLTIGVVGLLIGAAVVLTMRNRKRK